MIDGPETLQLTLVMLQTKTQIKQIYTERWTHVVQSTGVKTTKEQLALPSNI